MRLFSLPPAARLQVWAKCISSRHLPSRVNLQSSVARPLDRRLILCSSSTRKYATVHVSDNDKIFGAPANNDLGDTERTLRWDEIMEAARSSLDQHSRVTSEEKNAVLEDLQKRVQNRPTSGPQRRKFIQKISHASAASDPAVAIRQVLEDSSRGGQSSGKDAQVDEEQIIQAITSGTSTASGTPGVVVAGDGSKVDGISSEEALVDMSFVRQHMTFPGPEDRAQGYPEDILKKSLQRAVHVDQIRAPIQKLCARANTRLIASGDFNFSPSDGDPKQWRFSLGVEIEGRTPLEVTACGPNKQEAKLVAWRWVFSKCHTSGILRDLCTRRREIVHALQTQEVATESGAEATTNNGKLLLDIARKAQYAQAPAGLFQDVLASNSIHNICQNLNLPFKTQANISSTDSRFECVLSLQIPGVADESTVGTGASKQIARRDSWAAMIVKMDATGSLSKLLSKPPEKRKRSESEDDSAFVPDDTNEEVELVDMQADTLRQEKDGKVEVFNYAAKFGFVPQFDIRMLKRKIRRQTGKTKPRSIIQVSIKLQEQNIDVVAHGDTALKAEVAASLAFKRAAEELQAQRDQLSDVDSDFKALSTETARDFIEYFRKRKGRTYLEFENEQVSYGNLNGTASQLTLDGLPVGERVVMQTKKAAEQVAYLTAAVVLARRNPDILTRFAADLTEGNLSRFRIPQYHKTVQMALEPDAVDIMRQILVDARKAGLPDARETLTALEAPVAKPRERISRASTALASERLLERLRQFDDNPGHADLRRTRASLPMSQYSSQVVDIVSGDVYSIIVGATGSGKTTQVPQIILDHAIRRGEGGECDIICTQPRRLAASSVAERVAAERGEQLGDSVGYQVRGDTRLPRLGGSITYCTTGLLLERLKWNADEVMDNTSHLVIDEVHERDIFIDFLLIVLKKAIKARQIAGKSVPKVVLMSATMDTKLFSEYLPNEVDGRLIACPSLDVPGRTFPVREKYLGDILREILSRNHESFWNLASFDKDTTRTYLDAESAFERGSDAADMASPIIDWKGAQVLNPEEAGSQALRKEEGLVPVALLVATIAHICQTTTDGAILAFLPGLQEITATEELMKQSPVFGIDFSNESAFLIHSLHSTVPVDKQRKIFDPTPKGCRKIILSTNIAETSVTVPDVKHVVDLGKLRENRYDHVQRITALQTVWASNSNARQRAGRAGRVSSGNYYALYSQQRRKTMPASGLPELLRTDLQDTCLSIKAQGFQESVSSFLSAAIEPPTPKAVEVAIENLKAIEAFTDEERLTALGGILAKLPVHPALGKMILLGIIFRCLDPMIIISSMGTERSLFVSPPAERQRARKVRADLDIAKSDHIACLKGFQELRRHLNNYGQHSAYIRAQERFLHFGAFKTINQTAKQIEQNLIDARLLDANALWTTRDNEFGGEALNRNSDNIELVKCLLLAGLYPNMGVNCPQAKSALHRTAEKDKILMHPSSVNATSGKSNPTSQDQIYAFTTLARSVGGNSLFMRDSTLIPPLAALLFGGRLEARKFYKELVMDDWLPFAVGGYDEYALRLVMEFRKAKDRMLNGAFKSLSDLKRGALADDPVIEIFARGLVDLLDANNEQISRSQSWVPDRWASRQQARDNEP